MNLLHMVTVNVKQIIVQSVIFGRIIMDRVSVIIPTSKGREDLLKKSVESVKKQTHKNIELIIEKGGKNPGVTRNKAIEKATGKYIAFLDDDDEWGPSKLERQLDIFKKHRDAVLVVTHIKDKRFDKTYTDRCPYFSTTLDILKMVHFSSTSSYMFKTKTLKELKGFDTSFPSAQEYELAIRASLKGILYCVPIKLTTLHKTEGQISFDFNKKKKGMQILLRKHKELYKSFGLYNYLYFRFKFFIIINFYRFSPLLGSRYNWLMRKLKT